MTMRSRTWEVEIRISLPEDHQLAHSLALAMPAVVHHVLTESLRRDKTVSETRKADTQGTRASLGYRLELPPRTPPARLHAALARCLSKVLEGTRVKTRWWTSRQAADPLLAARRTGRRYRSKQPRSLYSQPLAGNVERVPALSERRNDPEIARDEHRLRGALWLTDHQPRPIAASELEQAAHGCLEDPERLLHALTRVLEPDPEAADSLALTYAHTDDPTTTPPRPAAVILATRDDHRLATVLLPHHDLAEQLGALLGLQHGFEPERLQAYIIGKDKV